MKKRNLVLTLTLLAILAVVLYLINAKKPIQPIQSSQPKTVMPTNVVANQIQPSRPASANLDNSVTNPPLSLTSPAARAAWRREMFQKDPNFEYKAPISFYGRVVDESNNPIDGVIISLSCVDASEATGETTHNVISDNNGLFSLEGAHGKTLVATSLAKKGYTESVVQNKFSFAYGYFQDSSYFSPNPNNPVIFVMHKDGPREPLIKVNRRFPASTNQPTVFNLGADASTSVRIDVLQNQSEKAGKGGAWMVQISVPNGGIQVSTNEFPIEAPETGYEPSIVVDRGTAKPTTWILAYGGGQFFVKTATGYGMMQLEMMMGSPHLQILSYYNPNNSRNLQP